MGKDFMTFAHGFQFCEVKQGDNRMDVPPMGNYLAYLLRLWHEGEGIWRGTMENPHTGERHAFADVESLLAFLRQQTERVAPPPAENDWFVD